MVFTRVLVVEFYRINAGFFLIIIGICGGFLSGKEHSALAQSFVSSRTLLLIPFLLWFLFSLKVIQYNKFEFSKEENSILYNVAALGRFQLWLCVFATSIQQLLLPFLYGVFLIVTASGLREFGSILLVIGFFGFILFLTAYNLRHELLHPGRNKKISRWKKLIDSSFVKNPIGFFPEWIMREQPLMLIGTKIFAGLLIVGISRLYLFDSYDERLMAMGCTLAFCSNIVLVYFYHRFENFHFSILRSLPITLTKRLAFFLLTITCLNFIEIGLLIKYYPSDLSISHQLTLLMFGLSIYLLAFAYLYLKSLLLDLFIQKAFVAAFCWIILILFKVPIALMAILQIGLGCYIYSKRYYRFEYTVELNPEKQQTN
jgi:hypothetical protein